MLRKALIVITAVLTVLALAGCGQNENKAEDTDVIDNEPEIIEIGDIRNAFSWVGAPFSETGLPEEYRNVTGIKYTGTLFGAPANGSIYCSVYDKKDRTIAEITVYVENEDLAMTDCIEELKKLYGEPVNTGEEPYAEVNGGSVYWERYDDGDRSVQISTGENNSWYEVECRFKLDKDEYYNEYLSVEDFSRETGYVLKPEENGITQLKIEKKESNDPERCEADYDLFYRWNGRYLSCDLYYNTDNYDPMEGKKLVKKTKEYRIYDNGVYKYILWEDGNNIWVIHGGNITEKELTEARKCFL